MKRFTIAVATLAVLLTAGLAVSAEPAQAPAADYSPQPQQQQQVYYQNQQQPQQQYYNYNYQQPQQQQGFFGRMMDLERRKNNALLRFFGLR